MIKVIKNWNGINLEGTFKDIHKRKVLILKIGIKLIVMLDG
jgi:hypothetical protein